MTRRKIAEPEMSSRRRHRRIMGTSGACGLSEKRFKVPHLRWGSARKTASSAQVRIAQTPGTLGQYYKKGGFALCVGTFPTIRMGRATAKVVLRVLRAALEDWWPEVRPTTAGASDEGER